MARTSAPAMRSAVPLFSTDWLPAVCPSFGVRPVSPEIILTRASGRSSSSAAICASAVRMPCPSSTLPVNTVTLPSAIDADPGVEHAVVLQAAGQPGCSAPARASDRARRRRRCAEAGGEVAARENGSVHRQVLPFAWAARSTARMIRLCVPQRQRLPASAARTSASLGRGLRSSSSFADMIMPLVQ